MKVKCENCGAEIQLKYNYSGSRGKTVKKCCHCTKKFSNKVIEEMIDDVFEENNDINLAQGLKKEDDKNE